MRLPPAVAGLLVVLPALVAADQDPIALARKSMEAVKANNGKARQYACQEYKVTRDLDKNGKETSRETETWEVIGLEGSAYRKLVLRNDKPLPPKEQKREDERLRKEAALRKKETPDERRRRLLSFSYSYAFNYQKLIDIFDLRYRGADSVEGRPALVLEGMPKPDYRPATADEKETLNYKVKVWVAPDDYCYARLELEVIGDHSRMQKGSRIQVDTQRHEDGVWLASTLKFDFHARLFKMLSARGEMTTTFSDYHKFQVDSRIVE